MSRRALWRKIYKQLMLDFNVTLEQLVQGTMYITEAKTQAGQRFYHPLPYSFRGIILAGGGALSVSPEMAEDFTKAVEGMDALNVLDIPNLEIICHTLGKHNQNLVELHHVYIGDRDYNIGTLAFEPRWYEVSDLQQFRGTKGATYYPNALNFNELFPEQLAVGAFIKGDLAGLAGASRDCEDLWQLGVDVRPVYAGQGIATQLVMLLRKRLEELGKVAIYGTNSSHLVSQRVAISAGFSPGWIELYAQPRKGRNTRIEYSIEP